MTEMEHATAHAHAETHARDYELLGGADTLAKAYSDYSFHGEPDVARVQTRTDETGENVARAFSSYSMYRQGHAGLSYGGADTGRARSDLGLLHQNPYSSGVLMRPGHLPPASSTPQMLFSREDGLPIPAPVHQQRREPRRIPSANDPNALYAQPEKLVRPGIIPQPPPPPPPAPQGHAANTTNTNKSRDGFAADGR